ncbi:hypothetical protein [Hymenobacter radiodurans]|uniref:hypothetical protein n=1 Tax=Hymenobacter radiodurans TaxID=2496028 RepID=UPI00105918E0|nr:hypothetical protein [Hymenobacter radiodurans]
MRPELKRMQQIEHQLLATSPPFDPASWEVQLLVDGDLRADTEIQRLLYQGIHLAGQRQLHRELALIHQRLYSPHRSSWIQMATAGLHSFWRRYLRGRASS